MELNRYAEYDKPNSNGQAPQIQMPPSFRGGLDFDSHRSYKDEEQTYNSYTPQYAGPLRIPPENFQLRMRKEVTARDAVNASHIETWTASVPVQQSVYQEKNFKSSSGGLDFETWVPTGDYRKMSPVVMLDMAPLSSRTDKRDFRQSQPFIPSNENLSKNPYFDRYDPTRDPRNMVREVQSVVYEIKEADKGIKESERIRERTFADRWSPEGETSVKLTEWFELLRPKIDNPEIVYRTQSEIAKLGSSYGQQ